MGTAMADTHDPPDGTQQSISQLGAVLKARRRAKRLSLRDLSAEIGVSLNTLSRVERGHVPDLRNFQRIVDWLDLPAETFLEQPADTVTTPEIIVRHLRSDPRLSGRAVDEIAQLVETLYHRLVNEQPKVAIHLRSAKTFTPAAGALLAEILGEIQSGLLSSWDAD
jgi:transcriptional regulator with XRE-family HTH domain